MPTILLIALRLGGGVSGTLAWYWRLPQRERQLADARTKEHIERTYHATLWMLTPGQAMSVHDWARGQHA